jgi:D-3-phosphoglycerate dehydrogenase
MIEFIEMHPDCMDAENYQRSMKYITDIAPDAKEEYAEKFGKRYFGTPKKQGAETAEANVNAGLAAARQIVDFFVNGNVRFQVNK